MRGTFAGVLLLFLSAASGNPLLGQNRCTWGPSYWCKHVGTMKECDKASFCAREWRSVEMRPDESPACLNCKMEARFFRLMLHSGLSHDQIISSIMAARKIMLKSNSSLTHSYEREMLYLVRQLPESKVCAAFGQCLNSRHVPQVLLKSEQNLDVNSAEPKCRLPIIVPATTYQRCKQLMIDRSKTEEQKFNSFKNLFFEFQTRTPFWLGVFETGRKSFTAAIEILPPAQICAAFKWCTSDKNNAVSVALRSQRELPLPKKTQSPLGTECELCEMLITEARQLMKSNKTEQEILDFVKLRVCSLLPAEKDKCMNAVSLYGDMIMQLLASELDPARVCKALGACGKSLNSRSMIAAKPQCVACELVMREVDQLLGDNRTVPAIESALDKVCSVLSETVRQECDQFVQQYTPVVVELLAKDLSPQLVCRVIGLCASLKARSHSIQPHPVDNLSPCEFCVTGITYLKAYLVDENSEKKLEAFLDRACNFLSDKLRAKCTDLIKKAVPKLLKMISNDLNPEELCEEWHACHPPNLETLIHQSVGGSRTIDDSSSSDSSSGSDTIVMSQIN